MNKVNKLKSQVMEQNKEYKNEEQSINLQRKHSNFSTNSELSLKKNQSINDQISSPNNKSILREKQQSDYDFNTMKVLPILTSNGSISPNSKRLNMFGKGVPKGVNLSSVFVSLVPKIFIYITLFINLFCRKISKVN